MLERKFEVIKGGIETPPNIDSRSFVSGFVTDTRLMGVFAMYIEWKIESFGVPSDLHQFFYFDAEEFGFENYIELTNADIYELRKVERSIMGGLGGAKVDISEREARFIVQSYISFNEQQGIPLPAYYTDYAFLDEPQIVMTDEEKVLLMSKLSAKVKNEFEAINYYLIRMFGKDNHAITFLQAEEASIKPFIKPGRSTLCKNIITTATSSSGTPSFLCESLIDDPVSKEYMMVVSEIALDDNLKVTQFNVTSSFAISPIEAAMQLLRSEYVTIYKVFFDASTFEEKCDQLMNTTVASTYDNGNLYMIFSEDNDHVGKQIFYLNDDVKGLVFMSSSTNQLIACSGTLTGIRWLEYMIHHSAVGISTVPVNKYEFKEPVFYDFVNSEFSDFNDFLKEIQNFDV